MRSILALVIVLFVSPAAFAADDPEAVFARFHRAGLKADVQTMLRHATAAQRARMKRDANWPTSYAIMGRVSGASRVVLNLQGTGGMLAPKSSGKATLVMEGGEWKVDRIEWLPYSEPAPAQHTARPVSPGAAPMAVNPTLPKPTLAPARGAAQSAR